MPDADPETQAKIDLLLACGPLKTWSVVVTILGDLYHARTDRISGKTLTGLTGRMGLSPQALRVAIHRLKKDGWLQSEKQGRESVYYLTRMGREETERVRDLVYARQRPRGAGALLAIAPPDLAAADLAEAVAPDALVLAPRIVIVPGGASAPQDFLSAPLEAARLPDWVYQQLAGAEQRAEYRTLIRAAAGVCEGPPTRDPIDAAVLRLLLLHHWRRLLFRQHPLASTLLPPDWEGEAARDAVWCALQRLPTPDVAALARMLSQAVG